MSILEIIVIAMLSVGFVYVLYLIYSPKKKKEKKEKKPKEEKKEKTKTIKGEVKKDDNNLVGKAVGEKKIEPAIKKGETPPPQEEEEEEQELVLKKDPPPKEPTPFKIIRKQSNVKISKQALKSGSRNPSITKVFDNGKRIDIDENSNGGLVEDAGKEIAKVVEEVNKEKESTMSGIPSQNIGHYGIREPQFDMVSEGQEFRMNAPAGSPNRAPIIGDRTHFASHLRVTDDNNLSGVMGTGVAKIIEQTEAQSDKIEQDTENMVRNVKRDLLGDMPRFGGMFDFPTAESGKKKNDANAKLKGIDTETLIIAQALSKRKGKK